MDAGTVIWQRDVDAAGHARAMRRFYTWYLAPLVVVVALVAIFTGIGNAAGVVILFGGIGSVLFLWVWLTGRNRRTHPTVSFTGTELRWARLVVPLDQVSRFTTYHTSQSVSFSTGNDATDLHRSRIHWGKASFELHDGSTKDFQWTDLSQVDLDALRVALERLLPGRWYDRSSSRS